MSTGKLIGIVAGIVGVIAILSAVIAFVFVIPNSVTNEGNRQEQQISSAYTKAQLKLSECTNKSVAAANVVIAQKDALTEVYRGAVGGRYNSTNGAGGSELDRTKLYSALQEAYPDLSGLNKVIDRTLSIVVGCQADFTAQQGAVTDQITSFNTWRSGTWRVRTFGGSNYPNELLMVNVQGLPHDTGMTALLKMSEPIVDVSSADAFKTGTTRTTNPFDRQPAPTTAPR